MNLKKNPMTLHVSPGELKSRSVNFIQSQSRRASSRPAPIDQRCRHRQKHSFPMWRTVALSDGRWVVTSYPALVNLFGSWLINTFLEMVLSNDSLPFRDQLIEISYRFNFDYYWFDINKL